MGHGTAVRRVDHGGAALPNNGEEYSHAQREKKRGKGHGVVITPS
jgi:hypothetical protein